MNGIGSVLLVGCMVWSLGCGPATKQAPRQTPKPVAPDSASQTGQIRLDCKPADALVNVDGEDKGSAAAITAKGALTLPRGLHRIEITRPGFRPFRFELILGEKPETLKVELQPVGQTTP
jgi:hypothetical protein